MMMGWGKQQQADDHQRLQELLNRLQAYTDPLLDRVEPVVHRLLDEQERLADSLDKKATTILGYALGLSGALVPWLLTFPTTLGEWAINRWLYACAVGFAACASFLSFWALRAQQHWTAIDRDELFPVIEGKDAPPLSARRYWLSALYGLQEGRASFCLRKGRCLRIAQAALVAAVIGVAASSAVKFWVYRNTLPPTGPCPAPASSHQVVSVGFDNGLEFRRDSECIRTATATSAAAPPVVLGLVALRGRACRLRACRRVRVRVIPHQHPLA